MLARRTFPATLDSPSVQCLTDVSGFGALGFGCHLTAWFITWPEGTLPDTAPKVYWYWSHAITLALDLVVN